MSRNYELMNELSGDAWLVTSSQPATCESVNPLDAPSHQDEIFELVQRVFLSRSGNSPRVVAFAGLSPETNLGHICSAAAQCLVNHTESKACIVDAQHPDSLPNRRSLERVAEVPLEPESILSLSASQKLTKCALQSAARDPSGRLAAGKLRTCLADLREQFDFIVVQAPQLGRYSDSMILSQLADGIILVLEAGTTRKEAAQAALANLRTSNIEVFGAILNNRSYPIPASIYKRL